MAIGCLCSKKPLRRSLWDILRRNATQGGENLMHSNNNHIRIVLPTCVCTQKRFSRYLFAVYGSQLDECMHSPISDGPSASCEWIIDVETYHFWRTTSVLPPIRILASPWWGTLIWESGSHLSESISMRGWPLSFVSVEVISMKHGNITTTATIRPSALSR